jgi:two-component system alkaline phosphatase synthesis response regulator PhoP
MTNTKKIVIIEDNPDLQEIYKISFESEGFIVYSRIDGLSGIIEIIKEKPDVILLDIMMPYMNGFEVLHALKNNTSINIPVIICSNLYEQSEIDRAMKEGADKYIRKSDFDGT